uniref:RecD-like helicase-nuclease n=1 Tax=Clandestinovirus TaxID=2831644 RepID=A0A8F8KL82_9VIRU|nr:RecD-like helicase-nuclease [Clandestinovirus]
MSYWKKSSKYLAMSVSKYDKTKIEPRKWFALYADCYVAQLHYIAHHVYSSHNGSAVEKRFIQLVEQREEEFENTRDASPTSILLKSLMKEEKNQSKISQHNSLTWYIPRECLAEYIEKTSYVWYWMAYHYKKKIPGWLTPSKLLYIEYKKKTDQQKIQTMILEQLLETMEHSLSLNMEDIASKVISKNPVTIKQVRESLSDLIKNESKSLSWLPGSMQKTLGLRKLHQEGTFTLRDPHTINSIITDGFKHIKDNHEKNADIDDADWDQIVQSLPFRPDETQQSYVRRMIKEPVCILKGPPGCGKTATLHLFNEVAKHLRWSVVYLGPTGRSVTRMSQLIPGLKALLRDSEPQQTNNARVTDQVCMTLDRAVYPMATASIGLIKPDVIVIDETSMVNSITAAKLLFLLSQNTPSTKLVMVGDPEQLFPVEAGSFFEQCIKSQTITTFSLTKIYRQSAVKLLQTCQNILNYQPAHTFGQIVLHDPNSIADCTAINGRERVKADEYKKMATADYRRSCIAIKNDVLARKFICPRTQGRLGVVEMNFMAQSVWKSVGTPIFPVVISANGNAIRTLTTNTGKTYTYGNTKEKIEKINEDEIDYSIQRGVVKKWLSYTKKPKNGENFQSAEWATLASGNAANATDLESGEFCFMPGDPVMCHSEVRGTGLTNGDECIIAGWVNLPQLGQHALLLDNIRNVFITIKLHVLFKQFAPSFCITAHKSQGGEYPHVFICMPWVDAEETIGSTPKYPYYRLLTKRLLYTSITRTKNICTLYGWRHAYRLCMEDRYSEERADFLSAMLGEQ